MISEFINDLPRFPFLQHAIYAALLASVACGIVGSYVVTRRETYSAGALSHCMLGGMGVARYLERVYGASWASPLIGALAASLIGALVIGWLTLSGKERHDTALGAVWAVGMAIGISFIAITPGYNEDLMSYLFGDILIVSPADLWLMLLLDIFIIVATLLSYNKLLVISFNEELARLRGIPVALYHFLLLVLIALTVTLLVQVVGIVMAIALLTLPAAIAARMLSRLWQVMLLAFLLTVLFTLSGLALSYSPELPAGATIIELAAVTYLAVFVWESVKKKTANKR